MNPSTKKEKYDKLLGIDNINDPAAIIKRVRGIPFVRMIRATNADIHPSLNHTRRAGYELMLSGSFTNVWANNELCLGVQNGNTLVQINPDISITTLCPVVGSGDFSYENVYDGVTLIVYYTNSTMIGKVRNGVASGLAPTTKDFKAVLPAGELIRYFLGSLYVVRGNVVFVSDVLNREIYDRRWGFKQFETPVTMFEPVKDGIYVSDSKAVYFMKRSGTTGEAVAAPQFSLEKVFDVPAVKGSPCRVDSRSTPSGKKFDRGVIWISGKTLCIGADGGVFETINREVYSVPIGQVASSVFRTVGDLNQYIALIK